MSEFASLCVLSFNRPHLLIPSLESLVENAGAPFELIVHDDGSSDEALLDHLVHLQRRGMISTLILNPPGHNQGQGIALNRMFGMAKGDPIIKLDQDLIYHPGWLAKVIRLLRLNPQVGLLGLFHYWHDPVDSRKTRLYAAEQAGLGEYRPTGATLHSRICGSGFALPRKVWEMLGPFDEHNACFAEDAEMQRWVDETPSIYCALPEQDLVENRGFGIGPSTVVVAENQVQTIHTYPKVHGIEESTVVKLEPPGHCISASQ